MVPFWVFIGWFWWVAAVCVGGLVAMAAVFAWSDR